MIDGMPDDAEVDHKELAILIGCTPLTLDNNANAGRLIQRRRDNGRKYYVIGEVRAWIKARPKPGRPAVPKPDEPEQPEPELDQKRRFIEAEAIKRGYATFWSRPLSDDDVIIPKSMEYEADEPEPVGNSIRLEATPVVEHDACPQGPGAPQPHRDSDGQLALPL